MSGRDNGLYQQPVDCLVISVRLEFEGREIDLGVPTCQQREIAFEGLSQLRREVESGTLGSPAEPVAKLARVHSTRLAAGVHRLTYAATTATAAGVAPGI